MKRRFVTLLALIFALAGISVAAVGCRKEPATEPPVAGAEAGEYYCDHEGAEYTLSITQSCEVTLEMDGEVIEGTYAPGGASFTIVFGEETATANYADNTLTLAFREASYRFLKKINYTVTFETNGGSSVSPATVLNGKQLDEPDEPSLTDKVFVGWYTDTGFKNLYRFNRPITSDLTLYARFVDASAGVEFTVSFDLGYDGAEGFPAVQTVGGVAYALPEPERDDAEFVGWWVSQYNQADKLTYRYDEQELTEDTTLYAVWASDAPVVSVEEGNITWSAKGTGNNYTVEIFDPEGTSIYRRSSDTTSLGADEFSFASHPAGDYTVSVTLDGNTTTAYYRNKALSKPNGLRVEGNTFMFNPVEGAESYVLTMTCGTLEHDHSSIELLGETSYNFGKCDMPEGGFIFTVTAQAEEMIPAVSDPFVFTRTLGAVTELTVENDVAHWAEVENASSYYVTVLLGNEKVFEGSVRDALSFDLQTYAAGQYTVKVHPVARGWFSPADSVAQYTKARLSTPKNVRISGDTVVWDEVADAAGYHVMVGTKVYDTKTPSFPFARARIDGQTEYAVSVCAAGPNDTTDSLYTAPLTVHDGVFIDSLVYEEGVLSWEPVLGASSYNVKVNDETYSVTDANKFTVEFKEKGETTLSVSAVLASGEETEAFTRKVNVYELSFDAQFGESVPALYLAKGDPIPALSTNRFGYTFAGWYDVPGGAQENGEKFEDAFYGDDNDLRLYAVWVANKYTAVLVAGAYGVAVGNEEIAFESEYTLPVPEATSEEFAFTGWYSQPNGNGTQYTDFTGKGLKTWTDTAPRTLYAFWAEIFTFTPVTGGYAVSKGPGIGYLSEVTVPQKHAGATVVAISDFSATPTLKAFNFYDTVQTITVGSVGIAFENCANFETINVLQADGTHTPRFWSEDGVLLGKNETTGDVELYLYPIKHKLVDNTYTIPDSVTRLSAGVFYSNSNSNAADQDWTLRKLIIPTSVTYIGVGALSQITTVREIEFLDPEDGSEGRELVIENGAFTDDWGLKTVKLPARLAASFSGDAFVDEGDNDLQNLAEVTVPENAKYFIMVEGLLCRRLEGNGAELVYYPLPHRVGGNYVYQTEIVIPDGVTSIASNAIPMDNSAVVNAITKIEIASTVTNIAPNAFNAVPHGNPNGFQKVSELIFHSTGESLDLTIGESAFYRFSPSTAGFHTVVGHTDGSPSEGAENVIELPENLVSLGAYAFGAYHTNVKTVIVNCGSNGRTLDFAPNAFASNESTSKTSNIETVYLGKDAIGIDISEVFGAKVKEVKVDEENEEYVDVDGVLFDREMTKILFFPTTAPADFKVPDSITEIGDNLFASRSLTTISLPATLTRIGDGAFSGCKSLTTVIFRTELDEESAGKGYQKAVELTIGDSAFYQCDALTTIDIPERTISIGANAFQASGTKKGLESITLHEGLKSIGAQAFKNSALTTIDLPASLEELGITNTTAGTLQSKSLYINTMQVFNSCYLLSSIEVEDGNERYAAVDGVLYEKEEDVITKLLYCPNAKNGTLTIPGTVKTIASYAFYYQGNKNNTGGAQLTEIDFENVTFDDLTIEPNAFCYTWGLQKITLPQGTKDIGEYAFTNCTVLKSINIPNTVTRIGACAFQGCSALDTITFEEGGEDELVLEGGNATYTDSTSMAPTADNMFKNCSKLTTVTLPDRVKQIQPGVFGSSSITSIVIPASVQSIGVSAFASCTALTSVEFAEGSTLTEIADFAFYGVKTIATLELPSSLKTIGKMAFYASATSGTFYTSITLNEGLETIGVAAFKCAIGVTELTIPSTVKRIEKEAFGSTNSSYTLKALQTVTFAENSQIEYIGENAFGYGAALKTVNFNNPIGPFEIGVHAFASCTALTQISLPASVKIVGDGAFLGCTALETVTFADGMTKLETIGTNAFQAAKIAEITFPESENGIELGKNIFNNNKVGITVHLSASVKYLNGSFGNCTLAALTLDDESPYFKLVNSVLYDADGSIMLLVGDIEGDVVLELGAIEIAANTFAGQKGITSVYIPASVLTIGPNAFSGCTGLKTVTIQTSSALTAIGANAFLNCTNLESINLQATSHIDHLGGNAFSGCVKLKEVDLSRNTELTILGANTGISSGNGAAGSVFKGTTALQTVKLPSSVNTLGTSAFENSGITEIDLSALTNLVYIAGSAGTPSASGSTAYNTFKGCTNLVTVKLPTSVSTIGANAFQNCTSLKNINLENVVTLGQYAFSNCGFETLDLPVLIVEGRCTTTTSNSNMGKNVFEKNTKLKTINIPEGVNSLGAYAFTGCTALTEITFPASFVMANVDASNSSGYDAYQHMFDGCTNLQTVTFKSAIETLPRHMFANCGKLTTVDLPSAKAIDQNAFENCSSLLAFTIGAGTENVGANAFKGCSKLATLTVESGEVAFGNNAFQNSGLTTVNFPEDTSKMTFGNNVFDGCNFTTFEVPNAASIGTYFLANNENLSQVTFADDFSLEKLPNYMLQNSVNLTSFTFPDCVTDTGSGILSGSGITTIDFNNVTTIGRNAFEKTPIQTITIPAQIQVFAGKEGSTAGGRQFYQCKQLTTVVFEDDCQLSLIEAYAFAECDKLQSVKLPKNLKQIGEYAFSKDTLLTQVDFNGNTVFEGFTSSHTFDGCTALENIELPTSMKYTGSYTFVGTKLSKIDWSGMSGLQALGTSSATLPTSMSSGNLFQDCTELTEVKLPESVVWLSGHLFDGCTKLEGFTIPSKVQALGTQFCMSLSGAVVLPETLKIVASQAFDGSHVTSVDMSACTSLQYIGTSSATTKVTATNYACGVFANCADLTEVKLPSSLLAFGKEAFKGDAKLKSVDLPESLTLIGNNAFEGSGLEHVELPAALEKLGTNVFKDCKSLKMVYIPSALKVAKTTSGFASTVFAGCSGYTIYTDGDAEALKTSYTSLKDATVVGGTTLEAYKQLLAPSEQTDGE